MNIMVIVRTSRFVLREFNEADWRSVHSYASDPEVVRYMDWGPNTEEETKGFIRQSIAYQTEDPRRNYSLAIVLDANTRLIGGCGLHVTNIDNREAWLGYCLHRDFWDQGYATETAKALLEFGFQQLSLHRIFATCDPANIASAHVLEKVGMKREGCLREHKWTKGRWWTSLLYAMLDTEWKKTWQ